MIKEYFNPMKVLAHSEKIDMIIEGMIPFPVAVEIDPSNACNVNCSWCLFDKTRKENNEMMCSRNLNSLMKELVQNGIKSVTFTGGGEPLVNTATIYAINQYADKIDLGLVTNGVALTPDICKFLVQKLKYIRISLDAWSIETYLRMKGTDKFEYVHSMINRLVGYRNKLKTDMQIGIAYIIHKDNWQEVFPAALGLRNADVDYMAIRPVIGKDFPKENYAEVLEEVKKAESLQTDSFRVFANVRRMDEVANKTKNFSKCLSTPLIGIVGADMNIYICCQMRLNKKWSIGQIDYEKEIGFFDLWGNNYHKKIIDRIDVRKCVPCRNGRYNEIIESFFLKDLMHRNFL